MKTPDAIVIGASAGGLRALGRLLAAPQADFTPPVLIVLHVRAGAPSALSQVLGAQCALAVREGVDKEVIERGVVYLAPPDYHLQVEPDRTISLSLDEPVNFSRPSIDVLFESAAMAYRERLLAIVLTGASADGAAGLAMVRECGGEAWVQDPADAEMPTMPQAALARAGADATLSIDAMCERLADRRYAGSHS